MKQVYLHTPVLLQEVLAGLSVQLGSSVLDATLGGAGYTNELLKKVGRRGRVLAIDDDAVAVANAKASQAKALDEGRLILVHDNFRNLAEIVKKQQFGPIAAIVADLGLSSFELDQSGRGFSFKRDEPLDMRFNQAEARTSAKDVLESYKEDELVRVFKDLGEERFARQIARNIVRKRLKAPLKRTTDLVNVIADSIPRKGNRYTEDVLRRCFQALRIEVNSELESLESFLVQALELLMPEGRLAVVSFHSLEDRIVKQFFRKAVKGCICPKDYPICKCGKNPEGAVLTSKPTVPSLEEVEINPRSKSAKLRIFQKI